MPPVLNRHTELVDIDTLVPHPSNPNRGDVDLIASSIRSNGFYGYVIAQESTRRILIGEHRWRGAREAGMTEIPVSWVDVDDDAALRLLLVDNRAAEMAQRDPSALSTLLVEMTASPLALLGTGYDTDYLESLLHDLALSTTPLVDPPKVERVNPRHYPLDLIFSYSRPDVAHFLAQNAGWKAGAASSAGICDPVNEGRWKWRFDLTFMDNDWSDYDHSRHVAMVKHHHPKYATTRDVMTQAQCEAAGVFHYRLPQVLEMAEELAAYAENVIIIPKYDCIADIPEQYVLGYSVPTSYGRTELPTEAFKGRRVHLLGGSWANQLRYLDVLGDDCVSLDNNHLALLANYGSFNMPDGTVRTIAETLALPRVVNPRAVALALSFGNIGWSVYEMFTDAPELAAFTPEAVEPLPDEIPETR